jgi:hypothetical protein
MWEFGKWLEVYQEAAGEGDRFGHRAGDEEEMSRITRGGQLALANGQ